MVKKGLKKGDIFTDGGRKYQVVSVNKDGTYVSTTKITEEKKKGKSKEEDEAGESSAPESEEPGK